MLERITKCVTTPQAAWSYLLVVCQYMTIATDLIIFLQLHGPP
jgi:hypothetical protein